MTRRRDENAPYWQQLRFAERQIIEYALEHGQTLRKTAEILGISPNYLSERVRELGIPTPEVRPGPKPGTKPNRSVKPDLRVISGDSPPSPTRPQLPTHAETSDQDPEAGNEDENEDEFEGDDEFEGEGDTNEDENENEDEDEGDEDEDEDADNVDHQEEDARESGN